MGLVSNLDPISFHVIFSMFNAHSRASMVCRILDTPIYPTLLVISICDPQYIPDHSWFPGYLAFGQNVYYIYIILLVGCIPLSIMSHCTPFGTHYMIGHPECFMNPKRPELPIIYILCLYLYHSISILLIYICIYICILFIYLIIFPFCPWPLNMNSSTSPQRRAP